MPPLSEMEERTVMFPQVPRPSRGTRLGRSCQLRSWRKARRRKTNFSVLPSELGSDQDAGVEGEGLLQRVRKIACRSLCSFRTNCLGWAVNRSHYVVIKKGMR